MKCISPCAQLSKCTGSTFYEFRNELAHSIQDNNLGFKQALRIIRDYEDPNMDEAILTGLKMKAINKYGSLIRSIVNGY